MNLSKVEKDKILHIEKFLKEAFCIDGKCEFQRFDTLISKTLLVEEKVGTFKLTDSKRGNFKIHLSVKEF